MGASNALHLQLGGMKMGNGTDRTGFHKLDNRKDHPKGGQAVVTQVKLLQNTMEESVFFKQRHLSITF